MLQKFEPNQPIAKLQFRLSKHLETPNLFPARDTPVQMACFEPGAAAASFLASKISLHVTVLISMPGSPAVKYANGCKPPEQMTLRAHCFL